MTAKPKKCTAFLTENGHERSESLGNKFLSRKAYLDVRFEHRQSSLSSMPVLAKNASHFFNAETYAKKFGNEKISGKDGFSEVP